MAVTKASAGSFLFYTLLRLAMWAVCWWLLVALTPLGYLFSAVLGLMISSIIAIPLLSRLRDSMSMGVAGYFTRMNERIAQAASAEDDDAAGEHSDEREPQPEGQAEPQHE